jgi:hypothetical protein
MSNIILRPEKDDCNFSAVGNPIVYKLRREDHTVAQVNNNGGFAQLQVNGDNYTSYYQVGNVVFIGIENYFVAATITASSYSGGNTIVTVDALYNGTDSGYVNNLSKLTDYKIGITILTTGATALGPMFEYAPSNDGLVVVNLSNIIKAYLKAELENIPVLNAVEEYTSLEFYISYQDYYDGTWHGEVRDVEHPQVAVFSSMQILTNLKKFEVNQDGGNMKLFMPRDVNSLALNKASHLGGVDKAFKGFPFTFSFLWPINVDGFKMIRRNKKINGEIVETKTKQLTAIRQGSVHRVNVKHADLGGEFMHPKFSLQLVKQELPPPDGAVGFPSLDQWYNEGAGASWNTGLEPTVFDLPSLTITKKLKHDMLGGFEVGVPFDIEYDIDISGGVGTSTLTIEFYKAGEPGNSALVGGAPVTINLSGSGNFNDVVEDLELTTLPDEIFVTILNFTAGERSYKLNSLTTSVDDPGEQGPAVETVASDEIEFEVVEPCGSPVCLWWKNSLGGDSWHVFDYSQDYEYTYSSGKKVQRMRLYTPYLDFATWEKLNELNTDTEVFDKVIREFNSSTSSTKYRADNQVYMVSTDGTTKIGAVVLASSSSIRTRDSKHQITIDIELPDLFTI